MSPQHPGLHEPKRIKQGESTEPRADTHSPQSGKAVLEFQSAVRLYWDLPRLVPVGFPSCNKATAYILGDGPLETLNKHLRFDNLMVPPLACFTKVINTLQICKGLLSTKLDPDKSAQETQFLPEPSYTNQSKKPLLPSMQKRTNNARLKTARGQP